MLQRASEFELLAARRLGEKPRHFLGQRDQGAEIGPQCPLVERRVDDAAMTPPILAFETDHAAAAAELEDAPERGDALVVVGVVLQHPPHPVGVADDEYPAPEIAALDEQFLEQRVVAGGERVRREGAQQPERG